MSEFKKDVICGCILSILAFATAIGWTGMGVTFLKFQFQSQFGQSPENQTQKQE